MAYDELLFPIYALDKPLTGLPDNTNTILYKMNNISILFIRIHVTVQTWEKAIPKSPSIDTMNYSLPR
jgi:hypothetical protein